MIRGIVVTTDGRWRIREFAAPLHQTLGKAVGGYIEHVRPRGLPDPLCMIVNEEGLLLDLPVNPVGCVLYGTEEHGHPIVGDLVILAEGWTEEGPDLASLTEKQTAALTRWLDRLGVRHG